MIKLGIKVKDKITGFTGVTTGRTEWLYGCKRLLVEPQELHDGKPIESQWFDEPRLVIVDDIPVEEEKVIITGGPQNDPKQRSGN